MVRALARPNTTRTASPCWVSLRSTQPTKLAMTTAIRLPRWRRERPLERAIRRPQLGGDRGPVRLGHAGAAGIAIRHRLGPGDAVGAHVFAVDAVEQCRDPRDGEPVGLRRHRLAPRLPPVEFGARRK